MLILIISNLSDRHSEVDLTAHAVCQRGQIEWHYTFPYLLVKFGRSGLPYTACIRPTIASDGYHFNLVEDGEEIPLQTHGTAQSRSLPICMS